MFVSLGRGPTRPRKTPTGRNGRAPAGINTYGDIVILCSYCLLNVRCSSCVLATGCPVAMRRCRCQRKQKQRQHPGSSRAYARRRPRTHQISSNARRCFMLPGPLAMPRPRNNCKYKESDAHAPYTSLATAGASQRMPTTQPHATRKLKCLACESVRERTARRVSLLCARRIASFRRWLGSGAASCMRSRCPCSARMPCCAVDATDVLTR